MKKIKLLSIFTLVVLLLTACGSSKGALTSKEFRSIVEKENFTIVDAKYQFEEYDEIKEVLLAIDENNNYQIEFYVLDTVENAKSFYKTNKEFFESETEGLYSTTNFDLNNKSRYTLTDEASYKLVSRIDKTIVYLDVSQDYKEEVKDILKKLGY